MIIKVPAILNKYYQDKDIPLIQQSLSEIRAKYGSIISLVSKATFVPEDIIVSFIFIESRGDQNVESFICNASRPYECPIGLMQITAETATGVIFFENKQGRLLPEEKEGTCNRNEGNSGSNEEGLKNDLRHSCFQE